MTFLISIHALHEESDSAGANIWSPRAISIHALHEESDRGVETSYLSASYFNPRSP